MTFKRLKRIIDKNNIPYNVQLLSDSGWECSSTEMDGIYYNKKENKIIFTQEENEFERYADNKDYVALNSKLIGDKDE